MASPIPKRASQRQRRNRTATAATLEALPARRQPLPDVRWSSIVCLVPGCLLAKWQHNRARFEEAQELGVDILAHDFDPKPIAWRPTTLLWWEVIWASPMADEWVDADVPGLFALAILIDEFWVSGDSKIHAEIRQASREFGLSPFSRRQLQWEIKKLGQPAAKTPAAPRRRNGRAVLSALAGGKSA